MSITSAYLSELTTKDELRQTEESETYVVRTDGSETARTLRTLSFGNAYGLPVRGEVNTSTGLTALKISITRDALSKASSQVFYYTVEWGNPQGSSGNAGGQSDPLEDPVEIDWGGLEIEEYPPQDLLGRPFSNSNGELYNPQPSRIVLGGACTITRNESANPASVCVQYSQTTNVSDWFGIDPEVAKFGIISATKQYWSGGEYWRVSYPITFNRETWRLKIFNNGFHEMISDDLIRITELDDRGNRVPTNKPDFLSAATGARIIFGADPDLYPEDGFKMFDTSDWDSLHLPNPFT